MWYCECTGITQGVSIKSTEREIQWTLTQPITAEFSFEKMEYLAEIEKVLYTLIEQRLDSELGFNCISSD